MGGLPGGQEWLIIVVIAVVIFAVVLVAIMRAIKRWSNKES